MPAALASRRRTALGPTVTRAGLDDNDDDGLLSAVSPDVPATEQEAEPIGNGVPAHADTRPQIVVQCVQGVQGDQNGVTSVTESHAPALQTAQLPLPSSPQTIVTPIRNAPTVLSAPTARSDPEPRHRSYLGDTGYMQIFGNETDDVQGRARLQSQQQQQQQQQSPQQLPSPTNNLDHASAGLQEGHLDVYFEFASTWCPVLDRQTVDADPSIRQSLLLRHALALCANQISPSLLHRSSSAEHYALAKALFYENQEPNPLLRIMAVMLFYWWSGEPPNVVSLDNTCWWTGTAIRVAQQIGLHHDSGAQISGTALAGEWPGLRRRIWWALVARERITSISQGRPCIIDLRDCDIPMPTVADFPYPEDTRTLVFVHWIPLCELIGRIGDMLRRRSSEQFGDRFTVVQQLAQELIGWVQNLPPVLLPAFRNSRTHNFHRDVHGLHLTYLSSITLLHLSKDALPLPKASVGAIVAASCTTRIFHDYLVRGSVSFLAGQSGWYIAIAILALRHACRLDGLRVHAEADIQILRAALSAMAETWHSARIFEKNFAKLLDTDPTVPLAASEAPPLSQNETIVNQTSHTGQTGQAGQAGQAEAGMDEISAMMGIDWQDYFPYVTAETSPLVGVLFSQEAQTSPFRNFSWAFDFPAHLNQFLDGGENINLDYLSL
ncbi:hypothetical protein SBRCBS47491_008710 [Sporothrix bragantina]|uniref:Xylanolytic transcriptional activator regulatory domain-containing protein n=1 Tax=Sporothrix bragantina TaxID=671064 RepID=A0ABP0CRA2_9PEZI